MNTIKLTREEALRRWNASKETKRKMVEKLETLVRNSLQQTLQTMQRLRVGTELVRS